MANLTAVDLKDLVTNNMRQDFSRLHVKQTVGEALVSVQRSQPAHRIIYFYVVDDDGRLQGVIPTRRLLLSASDRPLAEIMVQDAIAIPHTATVLEACEFFVMHRLLAFPVVDDNRRVLGVVDVELYTSELRELDRNDRDDELFQLIGVHLTESQQATPFAAFRTRYPWLLANIGGGILAAFLSGAFADELQRVVALAMFIPVVLALAESVSIQSVSLSLQVLRGNRPTLPALLGKLRREVLTGGLLGAATATVVAVVALIWLRDLKMGLCLLLGITCGVGCSAVIGVAMPNLLRLLQRDPRVAAGPVALAVSDVVTLLIYFNLARALF